MRVLILMDPIAGININKDSTFLLAHEAQARGYDVHYTTPNGLQWREGSLMAYTQALRVQKVVGKHYDLSDGKKCHLADYDVILMRQDPPFDMEYITITHWLEQLPPSVRVLNNPRSVRNAPEKLWVTHFPDLMPPTLMTRNAEAIQAFWREQGDIIIKPLFGAGGSGVFRFKADSENLGSYLDMALRHKEPLIAQQYLPAIRQGDKRIILIDGEPAGAVLRVPQHGDARANFHAGGTGVKTAITQREQSICATLRPYLQQQGLFLVGLDMIGDYVTEINVTSPTGFHEINALDGVCCEAIFWDKVSAMKAAA